MSLSRDESAIPFLLRELSHKGKEIIDGLVRRLNVDDKTRAAELDRARKLACPRDQLGIADTNWRGVEEDLR